MLSVFPKPADEIPTAPFVEDAGALTWRAGHEILRIEAWGPDSLRVRAALDHFIEDHGALAERPAAPGAVKVLGQEANITVGAITAKVDADGQIRFLRTENGEELLAEQPIHAHPCSDGY